MGKLWAGRIGRSERELFVEVRSSSGYRLLGAKDYLNHVVADSLRLSLRIVDTSNNQSHPVKRAT